MSDQIAIRVSGLSKFYQKYTRPSDRLMQGLFGLLLSVAPGSALKATLQKRVLGLSKLFWALKDVSFEVKRGEVIGVIGRNGAGKSTLLQMICGTVNPSTGQITVDGRVAALLELGAGFNPEFSGRDNVYINAAILGLSRGEIDARFNDIVAFAELAHFIDEPVKVYSSGMFLRLAFAVAVHVDPDILIVDEALSVGDLSFRNKCTDRIKEMVGRGVTILFVTHDLGTLQLLCSRVIWLERGSIKASGDPVRVSQEYFVQLLGESGHAGRGDSKNLPVQQETGRALFTELSISAGTNPEFAPGDAMQVCFAMEAKEALGPSIFGISIYRSDGDWLVGQTSREAKIEWPAAEPGEIRRGELRIDHIALAPGDYLIALGAYSQDFTTCYAMTDASLHFSVRASYPTWGKFTHPATWVVT